MTEIEASIDMVHLLQDHVILLRREHFVYGGLMRDQKLLKSIRCKELQPLLQPVKEKLRSLLDQCQRNMEYYRLRCCEIGTTIVVIHQSDFYTLDRLFDETFRSWRVSELKRLSGIPSAKRKVEEDLALQIMKGEVVDQAW